MAMGPNVVMSAQPCSAAREADGGADGTAEIEACRLARGGGDEARRECRDHSGEGHVDEEHPAPVQEVDEYAAEEQAGRGAEPFHRPEDTDGSVACCPGGEGGNDQRERRGLRERGGGALENAARDQHRGA